MSKFKKEPGSVMKWYFKYQNVLPKTKNKKTPVYFLISSSSIKNAEVTNIQDSLIKLGTSEVDISKYWLVEIGSILM